jgi:cell division protein FtsQ
MEFLRARRLRATVWMSLFLGFGVGGGIAAKMTWSWLTTSPRLAIKEIVVRTGTRAPAEEVRRLAGLAEGDNIIAFRLRPAVEAIELHPWVKRASVMRELPDRVVIEIAEREVMGLASLGSLYYVDGDGEIFKKALPGDTVDYPVFTGIGLREAVEDKAGVESRLRLGLSLLEISRDSLILPESDISEVRLEPAVGATLVRAGDGMRIIFGREDLAGKWRRMEQSLVELGAEAGKVAEMDLSFENRVTVRLRDGYQAASPGDGPPEKL